MSLSPEQMEMRRTRIGGSEIGALLGVSPHAGPLDVYMAKTLPASAAETAPQLEWGSAVEWAIIEFHAKREGLRVSRPGTLIHPKHAHVCATPDAIGEKDGASPLVIEVKNVGRWMANDWGDEGDNCPFHYLAQVQWELGTTVARGETGPRAHLVAAIAGEPPRRYDVTFDPELFEGLVDVAARFKRDHLDTGRPPEGAPSETAEYIRRRYANHDENLLEPTDEHRTMVQSVLWLRRQAKTLQEDLTAAENALKAAIGEAQGISGLCTWKIQKRAAHTVKESTFRVLRIAEPKEGKHAAAE